MHKDRVGAVAIGRNEGERLKRCIMSLQAEGIKITYVDSGSKDGSAEWAISQGISVVHLDMSRPFTAARARNKGFAQLIDLAPDIEFVQFIDGDCELQPDWLEKALSFLEEKPSAALVCGRRREKYPNESVFNQLCDIEWDTPVGETKACGGDFLIRSDSFNQVGGFRDDVIAGEEPELCFRLRAAGWKIYRLGFEMTLHDAAIYKFSQWWRRARRCGYAYALGASIHGRSPERYKVIECLRILFWGMSLPTSILLLCVVNTYFSVLLLIYLAQVFRLYRRSKIAHPLRMYNAIFLMLGKFPEAFGLLEFLVVRLRGSQVRIIEYK